MELMLGAMIIGLLYLLDSGQHVPTGRRGTGVPGLPGAAAAQRLKTLPSWLSPATGSPYSPGRARRGQRPLAREEGGSAKLWLSPQRAYMKHHEM
ncbi:MAG: hypothetical protein HW403_883 [Dehalococcoidia bacterium]|nr:hypothetical protein [Dehalococcoidia bacterium]